MLDAVALRGNAVIVAGFGEAKPIGEKWNPGKKTVLAGSG
jgi:hypothetical protein